jgi:hypothetical protein
LIVLLHAYDGYFAYPFQTRALMIAFPVFFFAIYASDRWRQGFLHDCLLPDFGTDMRSSQHRSTPNQGVTCFGEETSQDQQAMSQNSKDCTGIGIAHSFRQTKTSLLVYTARERFLSRVDARTMRPRFRCKLDERNRLQIRCAVCSVPVTSCPYSFYSTSLTG